MLKTTRSVAAMARSMPGRSLRHLGGWWGNRGMERAGNLFKNSRKCVFLQSFPNVFCFSYHRIKDTKVKYNCIWKRRHAGRCSGGIEAWRGPFPNPKYSTNKKTFSPQICVVVMSIKCTEQGIGTQLCEIQLYSIGYKQRYAQLPTAVVLLVSSNGAKHCFT